MDIESLAEALGEWEPTREGIDRETTNESRWLFDFCHDFLYMNDDPVSGRIGVQEETHEAPCAFIEDALGDFRFRSPYGQKLYMMLMPRDTYKTSLLVGATTGVIKENPNVRILFVTHKDKISKRRIQAIKFHLTKNTTFMEEFGDDWKPEFREAVWSDFQITVSKRTEAYIEPTVDTASVGSDMTGSHYDLIIADDLVNEKNVVTQDQRGLVADYLDTLRSMLDPKGTLIVTGTRWHVNDAYGRIIKEDEALEKRGQPAQYKKFIRSCWDGPQGLFFPKRHSFDFLNGLKNRPGKARYFAANYENKPVADEDRVFNIENVHIEEFDLYQVNGQPVVRLPSGESYPVDNTMTWDPAGINPNRKSDDHGITIVGTDYLDRWWTFVAEGIKGRTHEILERICSHIAFYKPRKIIIEGMGGYVLWIPLLEKAMRDKGLHCPIEEDKVGNISKSTRIQMLEPRIENGRLHLKPNQKKLISQITDFSSANTMVHEDILDSLAKHEGRTRPAGQRVSQKIAYFEKDLDYIEYLKSEKREGTNNNAGHHGVNWR